MDEYVLKEPRNVYWNPSQVCAKQFAITLDGDTILEVKATGGCNGNLKAISALLAGMDIDSAVKRLKGITCGNKGTSCADQLAQALLTAKD